MDYNGNIKKFKAQMMSKYPNIKIILASKSPRRKKILEEAGFCFEISSANVEEKTLVTASATVQANAKIKCEAVAKLNHDHLIIAADTVVSLDDKVLEKPANLNEAEEMLKVLSGRSHEVMTAVSISYKSRKIDFMDTCKVYFKELDENIISEYFSSVSPLDKAGAYNIDECGDLIIDKFEGEYENIMGLPIKDLLLRLQDFLKGSF